jgi:hypothetical protein
MKARHFVLVAVLGLLVLGVSATLTADVIAQEDDEVEEYPYVFQEWCLDHLGCEDIIFRNRTEGWLQIYAEEHATGAEDFFTIRPNDNVEITGRPGPYWWHLVFWCNNGEMKTQTVEKAPLTQNWVITVRCPDGARGMRKGNPLPKTPPPIPGTPQLDG